MDQKERLRILSAILSGMIAISGWFALTDPNSRSKFLELTTLFTGSFFALMNPGINKGGD